jgi:hypothetical protein
MDLVAIIAGAAVVAVGSGLALSAGRKHRRERHEVENFFSGDHGEPAWWENKG